MAKQIIGCQGEVTIIRIDAIPQCETQKRDRDKESGYIISHSEQGHHHVLSGGDVLERTSGVPDGMQVFFAMLDQDETFVQESQNPHGGYDLPAGLYEFRIAREFNPFSDQARRVAD